VADIKTVTPEEAAKLMSEGQLYLDVRSEPEFERGHPPGALNVPLLHRGPQGMMPNSEFLAVALAAFAKDQGLIIGCQSGGRSLRAAQALQQAGFSNLSQMHAGWDGARDAFGRVVPGWSRAGLPVETGKPAGQAYEDVKKRAGL
jgi:rhodanese-related sulfurtransferase